MLLLTWISGWTFCLSCFKPSLFYGWDQVSLIRKEEKSSDPVSVVAGLTDDNSSTFLRLISSLVSYSLVSSIVYVSLPYCYQFSGPFCWQCRLLVNELMKFIFSSFCYLPCPIFLPLNLEVRISITIHYFPNLWFFLDMCSPKPSRNPWWWMLVSDLGLKYGVDLWFIIHSSGVCFSFC